MLCFKKYMNRQIIVGSIVGLVAALLQSYGNAPSGNDSTIPDQTIMIIIAFGLIGGGFMAFTLLEERLKKRYFITKYIDLYSFFLAGTMFTGLLVFIQNQGASLKSSMFFSAYFFLAAGIGLFIGGIVKHARNKT